MLIVREIREIQASSTGLSSVWNNVQSVKIGKPMGEGGFGEVFDCLDINGSATPTPLVIKILTQDSEGNHKRGYSTILKLQERILAKNQELLQTGRSIAEIPGLYALPQFSFKGVLDNRNVLGYAAYKLDSRRFHSFDDILQHRFPEFRRLDLNLRFQLALDMAECFSILREINYIHADINPKNLFISLKDGHLVLIDYDSGVVVDRPQDAPTTWGKPDEWIAPEVAEQQNNKSATGQTKVTIDLLTDTWSVAVAMHYFIFCRYPYFFLNVAGPKEIKDYIDKFQWPSVDWSHPNFNQSRRCRNTYEDFQKNFAAVDPAIKRAFEVTFKEGVTERHQRASYTQWVQLLKRRVNPIPFAAAGLRQLPSIPSPQPVPTPIRKPQPPPPPPQSATPTSLSKFIGLALIGIPILLVLSLFIPKQKSPEAQVDAPHTANNPNKRQNDIKTQPEVNNPPRPTEPQVVPNFPVTPWPSPPGLAMAPPPILSNFTVTISSSPSGATVYLDRNRVGITPFTTTLKKGIYGIMIEKEGYHSKTKIGQVEDGRQDFYVELSPK